MSGGSVKIGVGTAKKALSLVMNANRTSTELVRRILDAKRG